MPRLLLSLIALPLLVATVTAQEGTTWRGPARDGLVPAAIDLASGNQAWRNAAEFTVEKEYDVAAASTYASPVLLGADLIVRDATSVRKLSGQ